MTHHRNRSEGLNIGEGFPTTYSTFAVTADNRADGRRSSASHGAVARSADSAPMKRRTSNPPLSHQPRAPKLRGYTGPDLSTSSFSFEKSGVSTAKSIQGVIREYRKRWTFVLFFLAFSALVVFGVLLPVSRGTAAALRRPGAIRREITYRSTRSKSIADKPQQAGPNRFARWAAVLFGPTSASQPVVFPAGMGDLELPDYTTKSGAQATTVKMADKQPSRRSQKRRTEDAVGSEEREHPSRAARREQASSLAEEDKRREAEMARQRQIRRRVMERVARAFKSGVSELAEDSKVIEDSVDGEHVLDIYEAAHPETVELDSDYVA